MSISDPQQYDDARDEFAREVAQQVVAELAMKGKPSEDWLDGVGDVVASSIQAKADLALGQWLLDIGRVRLSLRAADDLLRRMEDTVIRAGLESPRTTPEALP